MSIKRTVLAAAATLALSVPAYAAQIGPMNEAVTGGRQAAKYPYTDHAWRRWFRRHAWRRVPCMAEDLAECTWGALVLTSAQAAISALMASSLLPWRPQSLFPWPSRLLPPWPLLPVRGWTCTAMDGATAAAVIGTAGHKASVRATAPHTLITSAIKRL